VNFVEGVEGIFFNLPAETYHAAPGCSHSMLKHMEPPAKLPAYLARARKQTPAMLFGSVVHHLVLTPTLPPFWAVPPCDLRTTEGKKWKAENTLAIFDAEEWEKAQACAASVLSHPDCMELLDGAQAEVSVFKQANRFKTVLCKARVDIVPTAPDTLGDLKTCQAADYDSFARAIDDGDYHSQSAFYTDIYNAITGENRTKFKFIAVEKEPPFLPCVWTLDAVDLQHGRDQNNARLDTYALCLHSKQWPGYPTGEKIISRSNWARTAREREDKRMVERAVLQSAQFTDSMRTEAA
jgi:hypothetical protein